MKQNEPHYETSLNYSIKNIIYIMLYLNESTF